MRERDGREIEREGGGWCKREKQRARSEREGEGEIDEGVRRVMEEWREILCGATRTQLAFIDFYTH
jgi:hypothetical protein